MIEYEIGDRKVGEYGERMSKRKGSDVWVLDPPYDNDLCPDCEKKLDERDVDILPPISLNVDY
ncbi:hypothetical protein AKJ57_05475 [candidate division MSBL1 archaeon SCGC-AAA259A05]|uniref:Uncharacterized protein n=1 Tax=candidate division MSBL1 archaeon SCGC-AAA259A05 TaxID=1698259 RepID=A0A133U579_9EURY|nr:hypothetical protein AKJ57_05475 [candidate division MSBL1 archaeon SCGC-AAA259A05]